MNLAAGGQKAKYGALQAGWMPATPDEQARRKLSRTPPHPGLLFWQGRQPPACRKPTALCLPLLAVRHLLPSRAPLLAPAEQGLPRGRLIQLHVFNYTSKEWPTWLSVHCFLCSQRAARA